MYLDLHWQASLGFKVKIMVRTQSHALSQDKAIVAKSNGNARTCNARER